MIWYFNEPRKLFKLIFIDYDLNEETTKIIEKYENLGIIKCEKCEITGDYEEEMEEEEYTFFY